MRIIASLLWLSAASLLCCGTSFAKDPQAWKALQPGLSKLLLDAAARIEEADGKDADRARHALATALANNGDHSAARTMAARLHHAGYAVDAWSTIGRMRGLLAGDQTAAGADFAQAVEAAGRLQASSSRKQDVYAGIAEARAGAGDVQGALEFVQALDEPMRPKALLRSARVAALRGNEEPALALLRLAAGSSEKSQAHSLRALSLARRGGDSPAARAALAKVTAPADRIPVLLALFDHPVGGKRGDARLLDEALAAVAGNHPEPGASGFHAVANDAARGAIALRQLQAGAGTAAAIKQAVTTLQGIQSTDNARQSIERICEELAILDLATALSFSRGLDGEQRIGALAAVARGLGRSLSSEPEEQRQERIKTVEEIINQALEYANGLGEFERKWAGVPIARALADAGEFAAAHQVANRIDAANERAHAFAGIALAAIAGRHEEQARESLEHLERAALTETQPEVAAQIIAQATLAITQPLLGNTPADVATALLGLE